MLSEIIEQNYLLASQGMPVNRVPIWIMRQAGRYMASFRKLREKHTFLDIVRTPELAAEVTLQPIKAFGFDAAIIFSDILVVLDALGCGLEYEEGQGPIIRNRVLEAKDLELWHLDNIEERLSYVFEAIKEAKSLLNGVPLIGFAGAPFTLASYVIGKPGKHNLQEFLHFYFQHPELVETVLDRLAKVTIDYLNAQIEAGADAIQIFDSWNEVLPWSLSQKLSVNYLYKIINGITAKKQVPITVFGKGNSIFYPLLAKTGANVIGFDSRADLGFIRAILPKGIGIQGNLDPHFLFAPRHILKNEVLRILNSMGGAPGYIFNLGHGILPKTPEDNVRFVVDLVHSYSE